MAHISKTIIIILITIVVASCIGTIDSVFRVSGTAPVDSDCILTIYDLDAKAINRKINVSGEFIETITAGGYFPGPYEIQLVCVGKIVKSVKRVSPGFDSYENPININEYEP